MFIETTIKENIYILDDSGIKSTKDRTLGRFCVRDIIINSDLLQNVINRQSRPY